MNLFDIPQEKGIREWKSVGSILREKRANLYPTSNKQRVVHLRVRPGSAYHQQFFILKNATSA
jgi:hypothetical protein